MSKQETTNTKSTKTASLIPKALSITNLKVLRKPKNNMENKTSRWPE